MKEFILYGGIFALVLGAIWEEIARTRKVSRRYKLFTLGYIAAYVVTVAVMVVVQTHYILQHAGPLTFKSPIHY